MGSRLAGLTESAVQPPTPLERRIQRLGRQVIAGALAVFVAVITLGSIRGLPASELFMVAVSQVVSAIPEGLPVAITIALAVGMRRMAASRALVRRLAAVETLGSTNVICSDKTGTLTCNHVTVRAVTLADGRALEVTGAGYSPEGSIVHHARPIGAQDPGLRSLLRAALLCNDADLAPPALGAPALRPVGDPTEAALLVVALKGGLDVEGLRRRHQRTRELPFDASTRVMITEHADGARTLVVMKGAPEVVLALSSRRRGRMASPRPPGASAVDRVCSCSSGRSRTRSTHDVRLAGRPLLGAVLHRLRLRVLSASPRTVSGRTASPWRSCATESATRRGASRFTGTPAPRSPVLHIGGRFA